MSAPLVPAQSLGDYVPFQYDTGASIVKRACWYIVNAFVFHSWLCPHSQIKAWLLRLFGAEVGKGLVIKPKVNIKHPWRLIVGDNVWIGEEVWIDNLVKVEIRSDVCISQGSLLLTGSHDYKDSGFCLTLGEIYLEEGVWIAAKVVVCPGIRCARNSVITVGSILSMNTEEAGVYSGSPAILVRKRNFRSRPTPDTQAVTGRSTYK